MAMSNYGGISVVVLAVLSLIVLGEVASHYARRPGTEGRGGGAFEGRRDTARRQLLAGHLEPLPLSAKPLQVRGAAGLAGLPRLLGRLSRHRSRTAARAART